MGVTGLRGLTVAGVATEAGVSRPTVYKHLGDSDAIAGALIAWEADRFFAAIRPLMETEEPLATRLTAALTFTADYARDNTVFQGLLQREPGATLPLLTTHAEPLIRRAMSRLLPFLVDLHATAADRADIMAEWAVRAGLSLALTPPLHDNAATRAVLQGIADSLVKGLTIAADGTGPP
ncbi:Transcriptional regulator, TetR family [Euzebya pacifica]|uniref:Transcriptional regulator, TetR family n=1 Tax=Euzebya pacifica TaxID=1608957 RepID=A0A346XWP3_9ACTN|nr:Transcriptional regulator, TetR family [Euzebya pacifica]